MGVLLLLVLAAGCAAYRPAAVQQNTLPDSYIVERGDTLSVIAIRHGLDYRELAQWNQLRSPDRIYPGQRLWLSPPGAAPSARTAPAEPASAVTRSPAERPARTVAARPAARSKTADTQTTQTTQQTTTTSEPRGGGVRSNPGQRVVANLTWLWPTEGEVVRDYQPQTPGGKGIQIGGRIGQPVRAASAGRVVYSGSGLPGYGRLIIVKHSDTLLSAYGYLNEIFVKEGDTVASGQSIASLGMGQDNRPVLHFEIRKNGDPVNPLTFLPAHKA
jgi:lipoprotein NlpD